MTGNLLTFLFWLSALILVPAEKYYVTFVKGKVMLEKTHKPLKVGDVLSPEDKLIFADKTDKVAFISPGKGRFDVNLQAAKGGSKGELFAVLKSSLVPSAGTYHLSTRSLLFEGYDPATYFASAATQNRILLISSEPLQIKPSYKLNEGNFFFVQFTADDKTITRKVAQKGQAIIFSEMLFLTSLGAMVDHVKLCYQTNDSGVAKSSVIASFTPVLAEKEEINEQVKLMTEISGMADKKKLKTELSNHIYQNYGKIGAEELSRIFGI